MAADVLSIKLEAYAAWHVSIRTRYVAGAEGEINTGCAAGLYILLAGAGRQQRQ